ncbi:RNA polymerase ECF-type sigma factor [Croceitalea dokdonensis DOKDO 023]|uniref:RNA polymerase ECF-type sigma factor n=1 Tax=Croceitalea dokdonensis DOKDO 023 TaxID=1300341 RepID=A0A0P7AME5_9FLAO|nr:sigma-70 family RNA polymerase sigma factor [Croceitalea dokdonensis]KPM30225.1 RNA polymerase ECF-type sigma factor [Croceitalea dokdonensis DOKDO 023]
MKKELETIFLKALEQNQEKLFRICSIYSKDDEDAKDLFQEVLVHIWRSMSTFKANSNIGTWMFRIALNVCLRFKSKHTKNQNRFIRLDSVKLTNIGSVEKSEVENEKLNSLRKCLKELNEADKAIVALYLEGMAYKEISIILGLSENHVAVKIKRIKSKLLNCINKIL